MKNGEFEKRATKRRLVGLPAECKLEESVTSGFVRDITQTGAFISSNRERDQERIQVPFDSPLDRLLKVGDQFLLTFIQSTIMNRRSVPVTVCWQGISDEHGCRGFGVRYDTD